MSKRITLCAAACVAALIVAACGGSTPTSPTMQLPVSGELSAEAKLPKVDICHLTSDGSYNKININGNALASHQAHGDLFPGTPPLNDACVVGACATFDGFSVTGSFPEVTATWTDTVNTTSSYIVEGLWFDGTWQPLTSPIASEADGTYEVTVFTFPFVTLYRVVSSCGAVSAEVPLS